MDGSASYGSCSSQLDKVAFGTAFKNNYLLSRRKRCLDILGAVAIALIFSPVVVLVAGVMAFQKGPLLYGHERIGYRGKRFRCYKFRSMVPNAHEVLEEYLISNPKAKVEWERDFKLKNDPRITRIGKIIRKTSLDELPQLWNIVKGDMSLVGPRPIVREELDRYGRGVRFYLANRPGLTGLWQVSGRNDIDYKRRVAMDRTYAHKASFAFDLKIVALTAYITITGKGSY